MFLEDCMCGMTYEVIGKERRRKHFDEVVNT